MINVKRPPPSLTILALPPGCCSLFAFRLSVNLSPPLLLRLFPPLPPPTLSSGGPLLLLLLLSWLWWSPAPFTLLSWSNWIHSLTLTTQALRQTRSKGNRYHDPAWGQPPHRVLQRNTSSPQLNFKAELISLKHDEESFRKFFFFFSSLPHLTFPQLQGLLQQHECEGQKGWAGNQLAQVILHPGSLEERYSHLLSLSIPFPWHYRWFNFPNQLVISVKWDAAEIQRVCFIFMSRICHSHTNPVIIQRCHLHPLKYISFDEAGFALWGPLCCLLFFGWLTF